MVRFFLILVLLLTPTATAEEKKKEEKKETPRVTVVTPFSLVKGKTETVRIRGISLTDTTSIRLDGGAVPIAGTLKSQGKAEAIKGTDAVKTGDTQVEATFTLPADISTAALSLIVVTKTGETKPFALLLLETTSVVEEKEPNGGFREAQEIQLGQMVRGVIADASDVDVFKLHLKAGEQIVAEVDAARHGSPLDSLLVLYDEKGHELASNDDSEAGTDSILKFKIATEGVYLICLSDANGSGSAAHAYVLTVRHPEPATKPVH